MAARGCYVRRAFVRAKERLAQTHVQENLSEFPLVPYQRPKPVRLRFHHECDLEELPQHGFSVIPYNSTYHPVFVDQKKRAMGMILHGAPNATNGGVRLMPTPDQSKQAAVTAAVTPMRRTASSTQIEVGDSRSDAVRRARPRSEWLVRVAFAHPFGQDDWRKTWHLSQNRAFIAELRPEAVPSLP